MYKRFVNSGVILVLVCLVGIQQGLAEEGSLVIVEESFESGKGGWSTWIKHHPELVTIDDTTSTEGDNSLKLDGSEGDFFIDANKRIALKPSTKYLLKADIKRTSIKGHIKVVVFEGEEAHKWTCDNTCGKDSKQTDVWEHFELEFKTRANTAVTWMFLYNITSGGIAWFDNVQLIEIFKIPLVCPKCGVKIKEKMKFCPECGAKLEVEETDNTIY